MEENRLTEIEAIKKLKARYFRLMDLKLWDEWAQVFTADATIQVIQAGGEIFWQGREEIVAGNSGALDGVTTVHHGHMPEIEITGEATATGIWAMFDYLVFPNGTLNGYGHYHEQYLREDGQWKINSIKLTRLHLDWSPQG